MNEEARAKAKEIVDEALAGPVGWLKLLHQKGHVWIPAISAIRVVQEARADVEWDVVVVAAGVCHIFETCGDEREAVAVADELVRRIRPDGLQANALQIAEKQAQALEGIEAGIRKMSITYENTVSHIMKHLAKVRPEVAEGPEEILP